MGKNYICIFVKLQNIYVNVFKMPGKWEKITYVFLSNYKIYM